MVLESWPSNWNLVVIAMNGEPLPPGRYSAEIIEASPETASTGTPYLNLDFRILGPTHSGRHVWTKLPDGLGLDVQAWKSISEATGPDDWVFPSEKLSTPAGKDNVWRRHIVPKLRTVGLEWISFQVMRRTHSSLMNELNIDPKTVADQLGHTADVNQNVYTLASLSRRKEAVNVLEFAVRAS